ncbi:hypothetical protein BH24ACT15_BH24ACT15_05280 [soil metagenome]
MIDASIVLRSLVGQPLVTLQGRRNTVLRVASGEAVVATSRSPQGRPVPVAWLQPVLDRIGVGETVTLDTASVGHRSSFLTAVLEALPQVVVSGTPPSARLDPSVTVSDSVLRELERRLGMYAELLDRGGPNHVAPNILRNLRIYRGGSGVWADASRTRNVGGAPAVTVSVLHTGRRYPDELSDDALVYHYPSTARPSGRDASEVAATKAAATLRLPVFVVLHQLSLRTVRKGWVATWDDAERIFLIEFGATATSVDRGDEVDNRPFELFEDKQTTLREVRGRPNQQRFKVQVVQRYGGQCAICPVGAAELITAAHLVPHADGGTSDPRNGIPLCANHHTALDRGLIAIDPQSSSIVVAATYDEKALNVTYPDLTHLRAQPATEALQYRWDRRMEER